MAGKCKRCKNRKAEVYLPHSDLNLCADCFLLLTERRVKHTIDAYKMLSKNDKVGVAVSGGKDSSTLAYILSSLFDKIDISLIYIDLAIPDYSAHCLHKVNELAKMIDRELIVYSLEKELGLKIGDFKSTIYGRKICSACGTIKRYLFNKIAYDMGLTKIATGHNLNDTVEVLFNFYLEGNVESLLRIKPFLPRIHPKFVPKIKPLIGLTDMECLLYAGYRNLPVRTLSCQFSGGSRMQRRKELLNMITEKIPTFMHSFMRSHFKRILPMLEAASKGSEIKLYECTICGMPTSLKGSPCHFCKLIGAINRSRSGNPTLN
jgi:uncharacterized protein (TIGR00269 family)